LVADYLRVARLHRLNVGYNSLRPSNAVAIFDALKSNNHLTALSLAWNGLGDIGGTALAALIAATRKLRQIDVSNCRIGAAACQPLADAIRSPPPLDF
jgi:Ran GTPase-activating protein (RanGAP) involved in mRNA processing and transport